MWPGERAVVVLAKTLEAYGQLNVAECALSFQGFERCSLR